MSCGHRRGQLIARLAVRAPSAFRRITDSFNSAAASFKSAVARPSVNQSQTGLTSARASLRFPRDRRSRPRLVAARNSQDRASWRRAISRDSLKEASAVREGVLCRADEQQLAFDAVQFGLELQLSSRASDGKALLESRQCLVGMLRRRQGLGEQCQEKWSPHPGSRRFVDRQFPPQSFNALLDLPACNQSPGLMKSGNCGPQLQTVFLCEDHSYLRLPQRLLRFTAQEVDVRSVISGADDALNVRQRVRQCQGMSHAFRCTIRIAERPQCPGTCTFADHAGIVAGEEVRTRDGDRWRSAPTPCRNVRCRRRVSRTRLRRRPARGAPP